MSVSSEIVRVRFISGNLIATQTGILLFLATALWAPLGLAGLMIQAAFFLIAYFRYFWMAGERSR